MMKHDSDSYKIILKAETLVRAAYSLYNAKGRGELVETKVHFEAVNKDLKELVEAIENLSTLLQRSK